MRTRVSNAIEKEKEHEVEIERRRDVALWGLVDLYRDFLGRNRDELAGRLTEKEVARLARLKGLYTSTLTAEDFEGRGNPAEVFENPIPFISPEERRESRN
jgi:hypothetical protein